MKWEVAELNLPGVLHYTPHHLQTLAVTAEEHEIKYHPIGDGGTRSARETELSSLCWKFGSVIAFQFRHI